MRRLEGMVASSANHSGREFAQIALDSLSKASPTALKVRVHCMSSDSVVVVFVPPLWPAASRRAPAELSARASICQHPRARLPTPAAFAACRAFGWVLYAPGRLRLFRATHEFLVLQGVAKTIKFRVCIAWCMYRASM